MSLCRKILSNSWTNWRVGQFKDAMKADKPGRPNPRSGSKPLDVGLFDICTPLWRLVLQLVPSGHYDPQNSRRCPFKSVHISPWQTLTPSPPDKIRKQAFGYRAVWYRHSPGGSGGAVGAWRGGPPTHGTAWETSEGSSTLTVQLSPALNTRSDRESRWAKYPNGVFTSGIIVEARTVPDVFLPVFVLRATSSRPRSERRLRTGDAAIWEKSNQRWTGWAAFRFRSSQDYSGNSFVPQTQKREFHNGQSLNWCEGSVLISCNVPRWKEMIFRQSQILFKHSLFYWKSSVCFCSL